MKEKGGRDGKEGGGKEKRYQAINIGEDVEEVDLASGGIVEDLTVKEFCA